MPLNCHRRRSAAGRTALLHFIYAVSAVVFALTYAGSTWGLGRQWAKLPLVQKHRWLT